MKSKRVDLCTQPGVQRGAHNKPCLRCSHGSGDDGDGGGDSDGADAQAEDVIATVVMRGTLSPTV